MANILILTLVFPPDSVSTAHILGELADELKSLGHAVVVLTTYPHYNRDLEAERRQTIQPVWGRILQRSVFRGIPVFHTFMPKKSKRVLLRLLTWLGFHGISLLAGLTVVPRADVVIVPSPPLTIGVCAWLLSKFRGGTYIYNVQEMYPDLAISLGAVRNPWLIRLLYRLERFVYDKAKYVTVIAPRMRDLLLSKRVESGKVVVVPNFVDSSDLRPVSKDNSFSRLYGLHDKFVISYAGNMGLPQNLKCLVAAADLLRDDPDIQFLMLGDGSQRDTLEQMIANLALPNFTLLSYQPFSLMPQIYGASDVCLVPQAVETASEGLPSKVYRIMACARPVLAATDPRSDLAHLITTVGCGWVVPPDDPHLLAAAIDNASRQRETITQLADRGRDYVMQFHTKRSVARQYDALIREAIRE